MGDFMKKSLWRAVEFGAIMLKLSFLHADTQIEKTFCIQESSIEQKYKIKQDTLKNLIYEKSPRNYLEFETSQKNILSGDLSF